MVYVHGHLMVVLICELTELMAISSLHLESNTNSTDYTWIVITNVLALWISVQKRMYWLPFRFMAKVQILLFIANLICRDIEHISNPLVIIRISLLTVYIAHAFYLWRRYGPSFPDIITLISDISESTVIARGWLCMSVLTLFCSNAVFNTHYEYTVSALEGPLTSFQATISLTGNIKALVLDHCIEDLPTKCRVQALLITLFVVQWVLYPDLFLKAPLPLVHLVAEFCVLCDALRVYTVPKCVTRRLTVNLYRHCTL